MMPRTQFSLNLTTRDGARTMTLSLDRDQMSQRIMLEDFTAGRLYEAETSFFIGSILNAGDAFIDIGAHVGYFSMLASALVGPAGRVYSFEPEARNYAQLLEHIELNAATNLVPNFMAVGAAPSIAQFHVNADNDGGHALWEVGRHPFNERTRATPTTRRVYVTSLDAYFAGRDVSTLKAIKMDAEGAEFSILNGARDLIARSGVPFIISEINRFGLESMGSTEQQLRSVMSDLGYETYLFQPGQMALLRLNADQSPDTNYVFNLLFRHPEAPAIAA
jgi:FkbM family methyltransferase